MPDLFTHYAAARVPGAFVRDRRLQALLIIGTFLPDLATKGLFWVLGAAQESALGCHSILGVALISYLVSLFLEESIRRPGFFLLTAGGLLHIFLDFLKCYVGNGSVMLFLPFTANAYELSLIDPENVILLIPFDAAIVGVTLLLERRFARVQQ